MPTSTPSSESPARRTPSSTTHVHLGSDPCIVDVTTAIDGVGAVLTLGPYPVRVAIFFPDLQALWAALVEAERQAAHLATQPEVDTVVRDAAIAPCGCPEQIIVDEGHQAGCEVTS